ALLEETPLAAIHGSARDGDRRTSDLWVLIERLVEIAQALPDRDLVELVRVIELEERRPAPGEAEDAPDRVRLSSIHGAKGLEFPVVILPDLARPSGRPMDPSVNVQLLRTGEPALAIATRAAISTSWIARERDEQVHEAAEAGRLFYVACTRAAERLIFVNAPRTGAPQPDAMVRQLDLWGYPVEGLAGDAPLPEWPGVLARNRLAPAQVERSDSRTEVISSPAAVERAARAVERASARPRRPFESPSGLREDAESRELARDQEAVVTPQREIPQLRLGRGLGLLLHDALERWDFRDDVALRELVRRGAQSIAADESLHAADLEREGLALVEAILASDLPGHLATRDVLGRELPVLWRDPDETAWNGTIDLLYRDTDGRRVVADYKTDREPDQGARSRYRAQLAAYARGVARNFPGEPRPALELVWLRTGRRERLPLESEP
ncbi:MAG: 3'-5' exonuclease, partial [bacterium]